MKTIQQNVRKCSKLSMLLIAFAAASPLLSGCSSMLDVDSRHIVNEENKWKDINDARSSLMGVYGLLRTALAQDNGYWMYGELRSGDFSAVNKRDLDVIIAGELNSSYPLIQKLSNWRKFYAVINAANLFIENSSRIVPLDAQYTALNNKIDIAQMRVIKGFCYYLLARTWGDVPIWDKSYEGNFPNIKASPEKEVLAYAENQIKSIKDELPFIYGSETDPIYPTLNYHGSNRDQWNGVLFNRLSANTILAHIAAWSGNYLEASVYADYVLTNASKSGATFNLSSNITAANGFFYNSSNSQLVAFPFKWAAGEASYEGHLEQLTLASPLVSKAIPDIYIPNDHIIQVFTEDNDVRYNIAKDGTIASTYFSNIGGQYPIFSKIKVIREGVSGADGSLPLFSSAIVFSRLEEIALLRAEALVVLGQQDLAKGLLDQVRKSRGLNDSPSDVDLLDEIFAERRRELLGEGWRWYDLVRYKKLKRNDPEFNKLIDGKGIFWPIAQEVLNNNSQLNQNSFWK